MSYQVFFDSGLIESYGRSVPHYTIYPPLTEFSEQSGQDNYRHWVSESNAELIPRPLALFFHIPFSGAVELRGSSNNVISTDRHRLFDYLKYLRIEIELQGKLFDKDRIVRQMHWGGGVPTSLDDDQIRQFIRYIGLNFPLLEDDSGEYTIEIDPAITRRHTLLVLRDCGFNHLKLSSLNHHNYDGETARRTPTGDLFVAIIDAARRADYKTISADLIYGYPEQTRGNLLSTIDALLDQAPDRITLRDYAQLFGQSSSQKCSAVDKGSATGDKNKMLEVAIKKLVDANYVYIGMEQFAKPMDSLAIAQRNDTLNRNIQGYSVQKDCDLVAMGTSAISKIGNHFCQNTGDPAIYRTMLATGKLPISRCCFSSREDRIRRDIIQQLLCHARIDIRAVERQWLLKFNHFFSKEVEILRAMARDNLISMTDLEIQVSDSGHLLIRNICRVFDQYANSTDMQRRRSQSV